MNSEELFYIGHLSKTTGKDGALVLVREQVDEDLLFEQDALFVHIRPDYVPFMIEQLETISDDTYRVDFEDVNDPDEAEKLSGNPVYVPVWEIPLENRKSFRKIEGYRVVDKSHGQLGSIERIEKNPGHDLLLMTYEGRTVLIPAVPEIITDVDDANKVVHTELPEGLLEINSA